MTSRSLLLGAALFAVVCVAAPRPAAAIASCTTSDDCPNVDAACYYRHYICNGGGGPLNPVSYPWTPQMLPGGGGTCVIDDTYTAPAGTACTSDSDACTTDACDGTATLASCKHTPITCTQPANGSASCSGGSCVTSCSSGYRLCGGACIPNAACCVNTDCAGGHVCSGAGGSCVCPANNYDCAGTCISNSTCCASPNNCSGVTNGTGSCATSGGACSVTCNGGYKSCGAACIPTANCCNDGDCTANPANTHGVCGGGGSCTYPCNGGYKICGTACIPTANCCDDTNCTTPPGVCYKAAGKCAAGGNCAYPVDDGKACNADSNKCTPNDKCAGGSCVADTANAVKCVQRDCHTAPSCDPASGNCVDTATNGNACGGNGCAASVGSCTTGTCSVAPKDCTAFNTDCRVGICDAQAAVGAPCSTANVVNGVVCNLNDKCILNTACNGGSCVGTPKDCPPSAPCRVAACNSSSGLCEETLAPVGTACTPTGACVQNAQCDITGTCVGSIVPDGTPCDKDGCVTASACVTGSCICIDRPDFGDTLAPLVPTDVPDMAMTTDSGGKGCSFVAGTSTSTTLSSLLLLLLLVVPLRRRRAR